MILMQFHDARLMGYLDTLGIRGLVLVSGWFFPPLVNAHWILVIVIL
jgi:hypothetical protein